jgi:hypothetical protein
VWAIKPPRKRKKLADVKGIECRLLGYEGTKIYHLLTLEGHIICLSNVYFDENPITLQRKTNTLWKRAKTVTFEVEFPLKAASVEDLTAGETANESHLGPLTTPIGEATNESLGPSTPSAEEAAQEIKH